MYSITQNYNKISKHPTIREKEREREREFITPGEKAAKNCFLFSHVTFSCKIEKVCTLKRHSKVQTMYSKNCYGEYNTLILTYKPMYSPFSRESRGQKEARMLCIRGVNFSEQRRVK
jgi:hypothetical protein